MAERDEPLTAAVVDMIHDIEATVAASEAIEDWSQPHVLVIYETDPSIRRNDGTQFVTVQGPYPDYPSAAAAQPRVEAEFNDGGQEPPFRSHVVRLWTPSNGLGSTLPEGAMP